MTKDVTALTFTGCDACRGTGEWAEPYNRCPSCNGSGVVATADGDALDCVYCEGGDE